jgi:hypothetical protein
MSYWERAQSCSKHVEDSNKHIIEETVRQVLQKFIDIPQDPTTFIVVIIIIIIIIIIYIIYSVSISSLAWEMF